MYMPSHKCPAGRGVVFFVAVRVFRGMFLFGAALLWGLVFSACETGGDGNSALPLAGPRSVQVTARDGVLVLQWTKVAPAQGVIPFYEVYYGTSANPEGAAKWPEAVVPDDSQLVRATLSGLTNHLTWYVWVKAVYPDLGASNYSPTTYGTPIPPPAVPGPVRVVPGEEMLELTWEEAEDAFTYEVYYRAGGSGGVPPADTAETMVTVSRPGAVILGLANGTSYTMWVRARNTAGDSGYSSNTGVPCEAAAPPETAPGMPDVTPGDGKLSLSWDQVSGVPRYKLYYGTTEDFAGAAEFPQTVPANAPSVNAEITGLANGVLYHVWVQSWNSQSARDNSPLGGPVTGTPQAKDAIDFTNLRFELGRAEGEYIFAQDLPPSVFFPEGRPNTDRLTRVQETALGNLFTDGTAWYIRKNYPGENIDFVFLNGGYIDNGISAGTVTLGGISAIVQPNARGNKFLLLTLTGTELKKFFNDEEGKKTSNEPGDVSGVVHSGRGGSGTGFFGMVSAEVRYTLRYYRPPELPDPPAEIENPEPYQHGFIDTDELTINGLPIADDRNYRICTTDSLASGEYFTLLFTAGKDKRVIDIPFWYGAAEYIYDQGRITPQIDGRVKIEGGVPLPSPWVPGDLVYRP
jgi:hypothetical protein